MNILVFGASITWGAWDREGGWVQRLRSFLEKAQPGAHIVYNLGVSGDTSQDILERFDNEARARLEEGWGETLIIISVGANDSVTMVETGSLRVSLEEYSQNLLKLIEKARAFTDRIAFVGFMPVDESETNPIPWAPEMAYRNDDIKQFNSAAREICRDSGILFIDLLPEIIGTDWKKLLDDGVHPNSRGHEKIFGIVRDALLKEDMIPKG